MPKSAVPVPAPKDSGPNTLRDGSLFVVESECQFSADHGKANITIESDNRKLPLAIDELTSPNARRLAIAYASTKGMGDARINGMNIGPIPINSEGTPLDEVGKGREAPLPANHALMQPAKYRTIIPVMRKV